MLPGGNSVSLYSDIHRDGYSNDVGERGGLIHGRDKIPFLIEEEMNGIIISPSSP